MNRKELNFEVNILPTLDILSVLICFLLLTAVWVQIGTLDTRQAIGDSTVSRGKNPPTVWIRFEAQGDVTLSLRDLPRSPQVMETTLAGRSGIPWTHLEARLEQYRKQWPLLKTGIVQPSSQTPYRDVIRVMDHLKKLNFEGVGLSPLGS